MKGKIYIAILSHRHGIDVLASQTQETREAEVYEYVQEWWSEWGSGAPIPSDKGEAIDQYFQHLATDEWCDYREVIVKK